ncbi:apolipoprotein C-I [Anoplopoma fimbria]|uniref:apolipoprotein C-I n=1 Tax=Anoplopoma fimbria TaxID=229290 RepID=UPI0023EAD2CE|nr:apolipoprotein C-I [Anoplopoma fimbria]
MRLYLAVAVLMLAFVAYTEAQEEEQTIEQRFAQFGNQMAEVGRNLADKAKTTFEEIKTSKIAEDSQDWFQRQIEALKQRLA